LFEPSLFHLSKSATFTHPIVQTPLSGSEEYSSLAPATALTMLPSDRFFEKGLALGLTGADVVKLCMLIIVGMTIFVAMDFSGMSPITNYGKIGVGY
jgi:hypothetical protein